jgi:adenine-specific DNA-methyltransferase
MTPAERKLWQRIRRGQLDGAHFHRQHAVGRFIVDFLCARARLVVEVDGDTHAEQTEYDAERTKWLNEQPVLPVLAVRPGWPGTGKRYRVIRFTNDEVHHNLDGVVERVREARRIGRQ